MCTDDGVWTSEDRCVVLSVLYLVLAVHTGPYLVHTGPYRSLPVVATDSPQWVI